MKKRKKKGYWEKNFSKQNVINEIKRRKWKSPSEWTRSRSKSIDLAKQNGIYKEILSICFPETRALTPPLTLDSLASCMASCETLKDFRDNHSSFHTFLMKQDPQVKNELRDRYFSDRMKFHYRTLEDCKQLALKYDKKVDWINDDYSSYYYAHKHKFLDECCSHMDQSYQNRHLEVRETQPEFIRKFNEYNTSLEVFLVTRKNLNDKKIAAEINLRKDRPDIAVLNVKTGEFALVEIKRGRTSRRTKKQFERYLKIGEGNPFFTKNR